MYGKPRLLQRRQSLEANIMTSVWEACISFSDEIYHKGWLDSCSKWFLVFIADENVHANTCVAPKKEERLLSFSIKYLLTFSLLHNTSAVMCVVVPFIVSNSHCLLKVFYRGGNSCFFMHDHRAAHSYLLTNKTLWKHSLHCGVSSQHLQLRLPSSPGTCTALIVRLSLRRKERWSFPLCPRR